MFQSSETKIDPIDYPVKKLRVKINNERACSNLFRSQRKLEVIAGQVLFNPPQTMIQKYSSSILTKTLIKNKLLVLFSSIKLSVGFLIIFTSKK